MTRHQDRNRVGGYSLARHAGSKAIAGSSRAIRRAGLTPDASLRRLSQVAVDLSGDPAEAGARAREQIVRWLAQRAGKKLPPAASQGEAFEVELPGQHASAVRLDLDGLDLWAIRFDHPDRENAGRSWMVEAAVGVTAPKALFGVRLSCFTTGSAPPPALTIPGFVKQLVVSPGLEDAGVAVSGQPWELANDAELIRFVGLLRSRERTLPVFAISTSEALRESAKPIIDPKRLARRCLGLAHVVVIPDERTFLLSETLGRDYSVFRGAVRTYRPGFDRSRDLPADHPVASIATIESWSDGGAEAFGDFLVREAFASSVRGPETERRVPSFSALKAAKLELERRSISALRPKGATAEEVQLYEQEIEELRRSVAEMRDLAAEFDELASQERQEAERVRRSNYWLVTQVDQLKERLAQQIGAEATDGIDESASLENLGDWVDRHLSGRLVLLPRARDAAKNSLYESPVLVYRCLSLLAHEYRDMKLNGGDAARAEYEKKLRELGAENTPSISKARAGEQGDEYYVRFRGQRKLLDMHLKKGGRSRDERTVMRIYYFWDSESEEVIVGWLPGHLDTRMT